jgi:phosphoribosylformylglycinamidine cyclo-ligase
MAVNDLITVGATPLVVQAYWAAGGSDWFGTRPRQALVAGWKKACDTCGVAWGGGETPALAGIVADGRRMTWPRRAPASSAPRAASRWASAGRPGDAIVLLASSGIHANGLSLARKLAERLPKGYSPTSATARRMATRCWPPPRSTSRSPRRWPQPASCRTTAPTSPATAGAS